MKKTKQKKLFTALIPSRSRGEVPSLYSFSEYEVFRKIPEDFQDQAYKLLTRIFTLGNSDINYNSLSLMEKIHMAEFVTEPYLLAMISDFIEQLMEGSFYDKHDRIMLTINVEIKGDLSWVNMLDEQSMRDQLDSHFQGKNIKDILVVLFLVA